MYVAPTPFGLLSGVAHMQTIILPASFPVNKDFKQVGTLVCRKRNCSASRPTDKQKAIQIVLDRTDEAMNTLSSVGMKMSLGDIKTIQMGYLLTQLSEINEISKELRFIRSCVQESIKSV